jgi:hypothetical protein
MLRPAGTIRGQIGGGGLARPGIVLKREKAMNPKITLAGLLAVAVVSSFGSVTGAHAVTAGCIAVAQQPINTGAVGGTTGCNTIIDLLPGNMVHITHPGNGAPGSTNPNTLDGDDDTLVGVQNNSGGTVNTIQLSSSANIFGFDALSSSLDLLYLPLLSPGSCATEAACYEGPGTSFSIVDAFNGTVSFAGGLANGATAYFALENDLSTVSFTVIPNPTTPLPAALPLFATGLGLMGLLGWRRKRKARAG